MFRSGGGEGVAAKRQKITTTVDSALSSIDVVSHVASFLETNDLCQVKATCKALGSANDEFNGLSMAEEAARRIYEGASDEEKSLLPRYDGESWIELYYHLLMLRARLTFDQLVGHSVEYRGGDRAVVQVREFEGGYRICQAIGGNHIMRAGKHWATFSSTSRFDSEQTVGVIRPLPGWDKRGLVSFNPFSCYFYEEDGLEDVLAFRRDLQNERTDGWKGDVHLCRINMASGVCFWSDWEEDEDEILSGREAFKFFGIDAGPAGIESKWEGRDGYDRDCTVLGMLLDLDNGTLSLYQYGQRLGTLKDGLAGEYCWIAGFCNEGDLSIQRGYNVDNVRS